MTGLTTALIILGLILIIGSFFITEHISPSDVDKIAKTNMNEIKDVMDREIQNAIERGKENLSVEIEEVILDSERSMEKESNEKIMAISDYSDTVLESMDKTHNEIMFLYSMLNDKHKELTDFAGELKELQSKLIRTRDYIENEKAEEEFVALMEKVPEMPAAKEIIIESVQNGKEDTDDDTGKIADTKDAVNHNEEILSLYNQGKDEIEIAKELGLGFGEVKLVLELYREKED
ncbi:MAG: hypothetical protein K6E13_04255 [Lachnospiraceae bacterium]|nr:hypothetical protein [Lachnospiraceae bacterium]